MQTDVNNVLNDLKKLSDETDIIIYDSLKNNDQVDKWFSLIRETADAIVKGSAVYSKNSRISGVNVVLPNLVNSIKCNQTKSENRVSVLLAQNQKVQLHVNRKSRTSLRKILLEKKSNKWEISKSGSKENTLKHTNITPPNSESKEKSTESEPKTPLEAPVSNKKCNNSSLQEVHVITNNSHSTPSENVITITNSEITTPMTRSKKKTSQDAEQWMCNENKEVKLNGTFEKTPVNCNMKNQIAATQIIKKTKKLETSKEASDKKVGVISTPLNETITLDLSDSDNDIKSYKTPTNPLKRKSSLPLTQKNVKRAKPGFSGNNFKHEETFSDHNSSKKIKTAKVMSNISLQAKTSGILSQYNSTQNEKRILREIQKKEEIVNQNAKKIKSLRQMKIEENKKNREMKMEKAMQQRMKIEKEKEERLRCRTNSKQEGVSKKIKKIQLQEEKINSPKKTPESPKTKTYTYTNVASSLKTNVEETKSSKKAPPKPVRTPAKKAKLTHTDSEKNNLTSLEKVASASNKAVHNSASVKTAINELKPVNQAVTISALNTTYVNTPKDEILTSTPAAKKLNTIDTKTPLLKNKPISYAITPHQSSFVSYDISEIKSDDSDDDEEENTNQKPIPSWASSIRLRNAVLNQYYNPLDTDELFGNYFETPDLAIIMGVKKKQYYKRTSSAVWLHSPNRSILA